MKSLKEVFLRLKEKIIEKKKEEDFLKAVFKKIIQKRFKDKKIPDFIREFYVKNGSLYINTCHKSVAQELFWQKEEIKKEINHRLQDYFLKNNRQVDLPSIKNIFIR